MALQGFIYSGYQQDFLTLRYVGTVWLDWWVTEQDPINNTSSVKWRLWISNYDTAFIVNDSIDYTVTVDGSTVSGTIKSPSIDNNGTPYTLAESSLSRLIHHNKSTGTASLTASFSVDVVPGIPGGTASASNTWELNTITLPAQITNISEFTDESNPIVTFKNELGAGASTLQIGIFPDTYHKGKPIIDYKDVSVTATEYQFNFTDAERELLIDFLDSNDALTKEICFIAKSTKEGFTGEFISTFKHPLKLVNYKPVINPTITDTNVTAISLTGNNKALIRGVSDAYCEINAVGQKGAFITETYIRNSTISSTNSSYTFNQVPSSIFQFTAVDNRGQTTTRTITVDNFINYSPVRATAKVGQMTPQGTFNVELGVKAYKGSFGVVENAVDLSYVLTSDNASEDSRNVALGVFELSENGTFETTFDVTGLDYESNYTIDIYVIDEVGATTGSQLVLNYVVSAKPLFDWSKDDFAFNIPVMMNDKLYLPDGRVDAIVEQGHWSSSGGYRIYSSGVAICWRRYSGYTSLTNNLNGVYYSDPIELAYPVPFTYASLFASGGSTSNVNWVRSFADTSSAAKFIVVGMTQQNNVTLNVNLFTIGFVQSNIDYGVTNEYSIDSI